MFKSIRNNRISIGEAFIQERDGELWLMGAHIATYDPAKNFGHDDPVRPRKLLLHRKEINQILTRIREISYTAVPTMVFLQRGMAKVEIAVARGKKSYDKRDTLRKRDSERQIRRAIKEQD